MVFVLGGGGHYDKCLELSHVFLGKFGCILGERQGSDWHGLAANTDTLCPPSHALSTQAQHSSE